MLDMYYWVMLKAAVARAFFLEGATDRISGVLKTQAHTSLATEVVIVFYGLFVLVTFLIPVVALVTSGIVAASIAIAPKRNQRFMKSLRGRKSGQEIYHAANQILSTVIFGWRSAITALQATDC